jgi:hypothetical protein
MHFTPPIQPATGRDSRNIPPPAVFQLPRHTGLRETIAQSANFLRALAKYHTIAAMA